MAATLLLQVAVIIPHHHHDKLVCLIMEWCEQDNAINDSHTHHHTNPEDADHHHDGSCVADANYVLSQPDYKVKCKCFPSDQSGYKHFCPTIVFVTNFATSSPAKPPDSRPEYNKYIQPFYESAGLSQIYGLRAPPRSLS